MRRIISTLVIGLVVAVAVAACGGSVASGSLHPSGAQPDANAGTVDLAAAATYCTDKGGKVVDRTATWDTNGDQSTWLTLAGRMRLCEFEMGSGDETTRIAVDLTTLSSEVPTLAAVAYLSKIKPPDPPQVGQNPAQYDCSTELGGASGFGNTAAGGGWVNTAEPIFTVISMCVFADLSAIDEFGIWYYANGTVRGADLAPLLRYQPGDKLPAMFERVRP